MSIELGSVVTDSISGMTGIATARADYLNGCVKIFVEPQSLKDGRPIEGEWFDEQRVTTMSKAQAGGPMPRAPRA
jgi:hypothetical protein